MYNIKFGEIPHELRKAIDGEFIIRFENRGLKQLNEAGIKLPNDFAEPIVIEVVPLPQVRIGYLIASRTPIFALTDTDYPNEYLTTD